MKISIAFIFHSISIALTRKKILILKNEIGFTKFIVFEKIYLGFQE